MSCDGLNGFKGEVNSKLYEVVARLDNLNGELGAFQYRVESYEVNKLVPIIANTKNAIDGCLSSVQNARSCVDGIHCTHPEEGHPV
ncbi:hypothetical protein FACS1894125_2360 [Actinomycetota bacterium]|nr:hypothetical protein FACS1894125_2360 [Actinomycetota bacterium]